MPSEPGSPLSVLSATFDGFSLQLIFNVTLSDVSGWRGFVVDGYIGLGYVATSIQSQSGSSLRINMAPAVVSGGSLRTSYNGAQFIRRPSGGLLAPFTDFPTT